MIPVTVIILTHNEQANIGDCLTALDSFDDLVVVDSGSNDQTLEIIRSQFPRVRRYHHPFADFGAQRNWALDSTEPRHGWILFIDADEFMEEALAREIELFVRSPGSTVGAFIAGRNYFLGKWLKRSTFFPSYQLRLLRRGAVRYRREGHGQREVTDGKTIYLENSWRHEGFSKGVAHWIERHNRYSSAEIDLIQRLSHERVPLSSLVNPDPIKRRRALKAFGAKFPARPVIRFLYTYIFRRGFLDGYAGLVFCLLRFAHDCHIVAKLAEVEWERVPSPETHSERHGLYQ